MSNRDNFDFSHSFTKNHNVGKATKYHSPRIESERRKLVRSLLNALQRGAKFNYESSGGLRVAVTVPGNSGFGFA